MSGGWPVVAECDACEGWILSNGYKASLWQVFWPSRDREQMVCTAGHARPIFREGEAIPVKCRKWLQP